MNIIQRIKNEPVILSTLATAIVALLVAYHLTVTPDQTAAIIGLTTVIGNFLARTVTTSTLTPDTTPNAVAKIVQTAAAVQAATVLPAPAPQVIGGVVEAQPQVEAPPG